MPPLLVVGYLYAALCNDGSGQIKIGHTTDIHFRKYGWPGSTRVTFTILFVIPVLLHKEAEGYAHSLLDSWGCREKGDRKELFNATEAQARTACETAVAAYAGKLPAVIPVIFETASIVPLISDDPDMAAMLLCEVRYKRAVIRLGALMALAMTDTAADLRLNKLGVICSYRHRTHPEFKVFLDRSTALHDWARACGITPPSGAPLHSTCQVVS